MASTCCWDRVSREESFSDMTFSSAMSFLPIEINCCVRKSIHARIQRRPGSEREIRTRNESALSSSEGRCSEKGKEASQKVCYFAQIQTLRQGLERYFRFPRPCRFVVERVGSLASEFGISKPLSSNLRHSQSETLSIVQILAVVIAERLFVKIAEKM